MCPQATLMNPTARNGSEEKQRQLRLSFFFHPKFAACEHFVGYEAQMEPLCKIFHFYKEMHRNVICSSCD